MIYLDSAATSLLKPPGVAGAAARAITELASPGRGTHKAAMRAADEVYSCREDISGLFNAGGPERVVFCFNATHALNIAVNSFVDKGTRVVVSGYEHNSVMRPLYAREAEIRIIGTPLFEPEAFLARAEELLPWAEVVICTHVSNVFGYILPVYELGRMCGRAGVRFIVDASQSAGAMKVDAQAMQADMLACPGHKGLLGPQGTGILICKNEAKPLLYGGSGSHSRGREMPDFLPDMLEAGTGNVCGIAGLHRGVRYVLEKGAENIGRYELELAREFVAGISGGDVEVFFGKDGSVQGGIVSIRPRCGKCEALGEALGRAGVAVRTGLHCSPLAHETAGTVDSGTVRFSFSPFISVYQVRTAAHITEKILKDI